MGRHVENHDVGTRQDPGGRRRPPNSDKNPIPNTHQIGQGGQKYGRGRAHKGGHGEAVVNQGPFLTVQ